jgi:N-methylhydantoinase A
VHIQPELADKVLQTIAHPLGREPRAAARGAYDVAISSMTKAVKAVTSERGRDPRDSVMVAFGGAGPLYGASLARELGIGTVIVPLHTGLFSSLGLLVADTEYQLVAPYRAEHAEPSELGRAFDDLVEHVTGKLTNTTIDTDTVQIERILDMRYHGQRFDLRIPLPDGPVDEDLIREAYGRFHAEHHKTYGRSGTDEMTEIVNVRVRGFVPNPVTIDQALASDSIPAFEESSRVCRFAEDVGTPVISRFHLTDQPRLGPLIIEDMDSTVLVPPGATAHLDKFHNIIITWTSTHDEVTK